MENILNHSPTLSCFVGHPVDPDCYEKLNQFIGSTLKCYKALVFDFASLTSLIKFSYKLGFSFSSQFSVMSKMSSIVA